jgi:hypothetical protein
VGFGGSGLILGVHWSDGMLAERWMTSLIFLPFGLLGVFICLFLRQEAAITPEAAKLMVAAKEEVALWMLGAGVIIGVLVLGFNVLAALPVSVAIIIGALIIAGAVKK